MWITNTKNSKKIEFLLWGTPPPKPPIFSKQFKIEKTLFFISRKNKQIVHPQKCFFFSQFFFIPQNSKNDKPQIFLSFQKPVSFRDFFALNGYISFDFSFKNAFLWLLLIQTCHLNTSKSNVQSYLVCFG